MKSIMYVGATLMIGACIYGFVDYKKTSNTKEFKALYKEEKTTEPDQEIATLVPVPVNEKEITVKGESKKSAPALATRKKAAEEEKVFKKIDYESFSRAPLRKFKKPSEIVVVDSLEILDEVKTVDQ